jgi:hypothetical protein
MRLHNSGQSCISPSIIFLLGVPFRFWAAAGVSPATALRLSAHGGEATVLYKAAPCLNGKVQLA